VGREFGGILPHFGKAFPKADPFCRFLVFHAEAIARLKPIRPAPRLYIKEVE
jgi:hypothetical protein